MFKPVQSTVDFVELEKELLDKWYKDGIVEKYLHKNDSSDKKFSFLDGPITANNPMGVHHGWGRTLKDLWQRYYNMRGFRERFQNGFDEQGLWVEVEVEKELGLKNKKDIENLVSGDKFASLEKFINLCKERVKKYSEIQTEQSKRLGYFMDWDNSYHTSSEENNYAIWSYLKVVNDKGWLYKGRDSVPWCPRCGTAISQHEILTEEYKEITHTSIYFKLPIEGEKDLYLLVWTTTPWTIPVNVAVAADPELDYVEVEEDEKRYVIAKSLIEKVIPSGKVVRTIKGSELINKHYSGPFDNLETVKQEFGDYIHQVVASDPVILPISTEEGTGLVHIAPGAGSEDFQLGKKENLPVIGPIDESGTFVAGFGELSGKTTKEVIDLIVEHLEKNNFLYKTEQYSHRYPTCWRCKSELVWRVVDEWYIAMDKKDESGKTYREQMIKVIDGINWIPKWGYDRELDWLKNMHDWLISKKRYWGLSLPIWECQSCGNFEVVGGKDELKEKSIEGWDKFEGHTPHKPWIDSIKIKCSKCGEIIDRIPDVGNPWLDAGIVPFSTLPEGWFPADFVTEAFPGQFKNWFYSMIAMSTALKNTAPFKNLLGHALVMDEKGEEMHKSKGNSIEFNEAADKMGADVMRWMYATQTPEFNLNFGFRTADEIRRRFLLIFWNSYKFFTEYATLANWSCEATPVDIRDRLTVLDRWILSRLTEVVLLTNKNLEKYNSYLPSREIESFLVNDLSTWYIRRSRGRVGPAADKEDEKVFLSTLYGVLVTLTKLLAPFTPFISEEIFRNLTDEESVHLQNYPLGDESLLDKKLIEDMKVVRSLVEQGHAQRKEANIKLRQPLSKFSYHIENRLSEQLEQIIADELNVKKVDYDNSSLTTGESKLDIKITPLLKTEGETRELIRQVQNLRKETGLTLKDKIQIYSPFKPESDELEKMVLQQTNAKEIVKSDELKIEVING